MHQLTTCINIRNIALEGVTKYNAMTCAKLLKPLHSRHPLLHLIMHMQALQRPSALTNYSHYWLHMYVQQHAV